MFCHCIFLDSMFICIASIQMGLKKRVLLILKSRAPWMGLKKRVLYWYLKVGGALVHHWCLVRVCSSFKLSVLLFFVLVLCFVYPMLPVSIDCSFLIALSVFSNVYLLENTNRSKQYVLVHNYVPSWQLCCSSWQSIQQSSIDIQYTTLHKTI